MASGLMEGCGRKIGPFDCCTIVEGDCLDVMAQMPAECVDLVITSPPYDNLRQYSGYEFDFSQTIIRLYSILKSGGVIIWVVNDATVNGSETGTSFRQALAFIDTGFKLYDTMIYSTDKPPMNDRRYQAEFEYMFVFSKDFPKTFNPIMVPCKRAGESRSGTTYRNPDGSKKDTWSSGQVANTKIKGNIWHFNSGYMHSSKNPAIFEHPAVFPELLVRDQMVSWSDYGDLIADPFMGSGTTAKIAKQLGRHFFGCDINPKYVAMAEKRLSAVQLAMEL